MFSTPHRPIVAALLAALWLPNAALPAGTNTTIAITGQQAGGAPSGAVFADFWSTPVLNDASQVAFAASSPPAAAGSPRATTAASAATPP
jgi:hypothetical protein